MELALDLNYKDVIQQYGQFLDNDTSGDSPNARLTQMISKKEKRLIVDLNVLREMNPTRCAQLLSNSQEELLIFQKALREAVTIIDSDFASKTDNFLLGFEGSFGSRHVSPRTLKSQFIGNIVCCEGIVTKASLVRPKVVRSVHYCPKTNKILEQKYSDMTSLEGVPTTTIYPTKDADGNPLETEYGLCTFKDYQSFTIQEMPENAPAGQLPRSVEVIVEHDLVDVCKPGDRVQIIGMFRCLPSKKSNFIAGSFRTVLIANNIRLLSKDIAPNFSVDDVKTIKSFAKKQKGLFTLLARSLAPSICGHDYIKKAILCQLVGGSEKVLENGTRLRGDINILMVGDPSTAKSQLLRYVLHAAPRAIPTTGRGTTGVGLTAAVTMDADTGDKRLEAGAMVLADRGIVCIDEFDKMSDADRTAIHEVMEQGRVTISKAGIHARLNARCSVLAAANPVYGRYDEYKTPMENISMQDSLLSRFDLLFIVLDHTNIDSDYIVSEHVLKMHQYRDPNEADGEVMPLGESIEFLSTKNLESTDNNDQPLRIFEKEDAKLYSDSANKKKYVTMEFLNKYIHLAKQLKPELSDEAISVIVEAYTNLRKQANDNANTQLAKTMPVTARSFETLIRLATAHAKLRLSKTIDKIDAKTAVDLVHFSFFHKVEKKKSRKRTEPSAGVDSESDGSDYYDLSDGNGGVDEVEKITSTNEHVSANSTQGSTLLVDGNAAPDVVDQSKMNAFKSVLLDVFTKANSQAIELSELTAELQTTHSSVNLDADEVIVYLKAMQDENKIMLVDDTIYLI